MKVAGFKLGSLVCSMLLFLFMIAVSSGIANAWGVSYSTDELRMQAGQSADISYEMQNFVGDDTLRIKVSLEGDAEIAQIVGEDVFTLPPKTKDTYAKIRITIPSNALSQYTLKIKFLTMTGQGGFSINSAKIIPLTINVADGYGQAAQASSDSQAQSDTAAQQTSLAGAGQATQGNGQSAQAAANTGAGATTASGLFVLDERSGLTGSALFKFAMLAAVIFIAAAGYWKFSKTRRVEFL
jgi:uncharacterized membrane protein